VSPRRVTKVTAILKPATLLRFHKALVDRKYRRLFSSIGTRVKPGPKGPSEELIATIIEMKRRNPRFGYQRIAQQIVYTFGVEIDKDVVRRVLAKHLTCRYPDPSGPSWLTFFCAHQGQSLERRSLSLRVDSPSQPLGSRGDRRVYPSNHRIRDRRRIHRWR